jgi:hypothetical protein
MLEDFAQDIVEFIRLPNDVGIVAQSCGEGVAEFRYSPNARLIIVCCEAVDWFIKRAALGPEAFGPSAGGGAGAATAPFGRRQVSSQPCRRRAQVLSCCE